MPKKQFLVGVADVTAYGDEGVALFKSTTMLNTSIDISTGSTEISGGKRNKLQGIYYHTARMNVTLEDTEWNKEWVRQNTGANYVSWTVPRKESITLSSTGGVVTGAPVAMVGNTDITGTIEKPDGSLVTVQFTGNAFTLPVGFAAGDRVCVEYFVIDANADSIAIPASILPKIVRLVMNVDIASNTSGEGVIGNAIVEIPACQLSGAQTINMTADGYSTVPLTGMALAFTPTAGTNACSNGDIYAVITTVLNDATWYSDIVALGIEGGDFTLPATAGSQKTLNLIAITSGGATKPVPVSGITVSSGTQTTATVSTATGSVVVTSVSTTSDETTLITVSIANTSIEASCTCTIE